MRFLFLVSFVALGFCAETEFKSDEFFRALQGVLETKDGKDQASATDMTVRVTITNGKTQKSWFMDFADGKAELLENVEHDKEADCTVEAEENVLLDVLAGNSQLFDAVTDGRVSVDGNILKAMNIGSVLELAAKTESMKEFKRKFKTEL